MIGHEKSVPANEELELLFTAVRADERRNYAALVADRLERLANYFAAYPENLDAEVSDVVEALRAEAGNFHRVALGG